MYDARRTRYESFCSVVVCTREESLQDFPLKKKDSVSGLREDVVSHEMVFDGRHSNDIMEQTVDTERVFYVIFVIEVRNYYDQLDARNLISFELLDRLLHISGHKKKTQSSLETSASPLDTTQSVEYDTEWRSYWRVSRSLIKRGKSRTRNVDVRSQDHDQWHKSVKIRWRLKTRRVPDAVNRDRRPSGKLKSRRS